MVHNSADDGLVSELRRVGIEVRSVYDLVNSKRSYPAAIPVLVSHLDKNLDARTLEGVVRALSVREARGVANHALLRLFEESDNELLKWCVANALSVVVKEEDFEALVRLAADSRHGKSRQMLLAALGKTKDERAVDLLTRLLEDETLVGHALAALGSLKAASARTRVEALTRHDKPWVRKEAVRALAKIDAGAQSRQS